MRFPRSAASTSWPVRIPSTVSPHLETHDEDLLLRRRHPRGTRHGLSLP